MAKSAAARAEARFKQLCCLGLGGEAVMPALLYELHDVIPFFCGTFDFADDKSAFVNAYFDNPDIVSIVPLYMEVFLNKRDRELPGNSYADAMRSQFGVHDYAKAVAVDRETFRRSDMYNLIFRRMGYEPDFLRLIVRENGRGRGMLTLYRSPGTRPWSSEDKRRLGALESFFVHALKSDGEGEVVPLVDSGRSGLIIADPHGKPIYFSADARRFLFLVTNPRIAPDVAFDRSVPLPAPVTRICRDLHRIFSDDGTVSAPVYHHKNIWGGFTFRAHWLEASDPGSGLIGITLSHEEPLPVRLVRSAGSLPLSRRQAEICVLMASGASNEKIAEQLGISKHTAIAHGRWIYNKLDVHNRAELTSKLLSV